MRPTHTHTVTTPPPSPSFTTRSHPAGRRTTSSWRAFGVRRQFGFGFGRAIFKPQEVRAAGLCQAVWLAFFCCSLMHVCVSQSVCVCATVCATLFAASLPAVCRHFYNTMLLCQRQVVDIVLPSLDCFLI